MNSKTQTIENKIPEPNTFEIAKGIVLHKETESRVQRKTKSRVSSRIIIAVIGYFLCVCGAIAFTAGSFLSRGYFTVGGESLLILQLFFLSTYILIKEGKYAN